MEEEFQPQVNLKKQGSVKSPKQNNFVVPDDGAWGMLHKKGVGRIYLKSQIEKIYPKSEVIQIVKELKKCGGQTKGAIFCGAVGTGKTSILAYLAFMCVKEFARLGPLFKYGGENEWWEMPNIEFISVGDLFDLFFDRKIDVIDQIRDCRLLFLDDFGREYHSDYPLSRFENFLEHRYAELMTTFITTNLSPKALIKERKWARIVDRFRDEKWMRIVEIKGKSMRG